MEKINEIYKKNSINILALLVGAVALFLYSFFASHNIFPGDSTEFISVVASRGVAHPPGYPLFTLLAHIANFILPFSSVAFKVNLVAAFFGAATISTVFLIIYNLTKKISAAFFGSLLLALEPPFLLYSLVAEVFTLHAFIFVLIILLTLKFLEKPTPKLFYIVSSILGLGFSNHHTIIFIIPALTFILWKKRTAFPYFWLNLCLSAIFFLLGFLPYVSILLFARQNPLINWNNAINLHNLLDLFLRKSYGTLTLAPGNLAFIPHKSAFDYFVKYLITHWAGLPFIFASFGIAHIVACKLWNRFVLLVLTLLFFGPVFYLMANTPMIAVNQYAAMERFLIIPLVIIAILASIGFNRLLSKRQLKRLSIIVFLVLLIPLWQLNKLNLREFNLYSDIAREGLELLPANAIYLTVGDIWSMPADYLQIQGLRNDVRKLNVMKLSAKWYQKEISQRYPEFTPYLAEKTEDTLRNLCRAYSEEGLLYASSWLAELETTSDACKPIQEKLLIRLVSPSANMDIEKYKIEQDKYWNDFFVRYSLPDSEKSNFRVRRLLESIAEIHHRLAGLYWKNGKIEWAKEEYATANLISADHTDSLYNLAVIEGESGNASVALELLKKAIIKNSESPLSYFAAAKYSLELGLNEDAKMYLSKFLSFSPDPAVYSQVTQAKDFLRN